MVIVLCDNIVRDQGTLTQDNHTRVKHFQEQDISLIMTKDARFITVLMKFSEIT